MAQQEAINFSTGTSIMCNKIPSRDSTMNRSKSRGKPQQQKQEEPIKPKIGRKKDVEIATTKPLKEENPADIYNNRNTVILEDMKFYETEISNEDEEDNKAQ